MNTIHNEGEVRPSATPGDPYAEPYDVPLFGLRRREWRVIPPGACRLGPSCLVCQWRRAGLLDSAPPTPVVREAQPEAWPCPSSYCPGCGRVHCACLPAGYDDALGDAAFALGFDHGAADGPDNRPTRRWLAEAGLDAVTDEYLDGYDAGCDGAPPPVGMPLSVAVVLLGRAV